MWIQGLTHKSHISSRGITLTEEEVDLRVHSYRGGSYLDAGDHSYKEGITNTKKGSLRDGIINMIKIQGITHTEMISRSDPLTLSFQGKKKVFLHPCLYIEY